MATCTKCGASLEIDATKRYDNGKTWIDTNGVHSGTYCAACVQTLDGAASNFVVAGSLAHDYATQSVQRFMLDAYECPTCHKIETVERGTGDEMYCPVCLNVLESIGHASVLRHTPRVYDELADCLACGTQVGVFIWENGRKFTQECPACGALLEAWRNSDGGAETDVIKGADGALLVHRPHFLYWNATQEN